MLAGARASSRLLNHSTRVSVFVLWVVLRACLAGRTVGRGPETRAVSGLLRGDRVVGTPEGSSQLRTCVRQKSLRRAKARLCDTLLTGRAGICAMRQRKGHGPVVVGDRATVAGLGTGLDCTRAGCVASCSVREGDVRGRGQAAVDRGMSGVVCGWVCVGVRSRAGANEGGQEWEKVRWVDDPDKSMARARAHERGKRGRDVQAGAATWARIASPGRLLRGPLLRSLSAGFGSWVTIAWLPSLDCAYLSQVRSQTPVHGPR